MRYALELNMYIYAENEAELSQKAKEIETLLNKLDYTSDADVKPIAYEVEFGKKSFFPKQIRINKNLNNGKDKRNKNV